MKQTLVHGEGVVKPSDGNEVIFTLTVYLEKDILITKQYQNFLKLENYNEEEMIILKSFKKNEKSRILIRREYISNTKLFDEELKQQILNSDARITYELELLKFKQNLSIVTSNGTRIQKIQLNKGLGNQCPWKNSTAMLAINVLQNGNTIYSDFESKPSDFINNIKTLKKEIKQINRYELNLQFIINEKIGQIYPIYNTLHHCLPEFISEGIASMKLLEIVNYKFTGSIDYFKIQNSDIEIMNQNADYEITVCLINFQESFNLFNKSLQTDDERLNKVKHFRTLANYYFSQKLMERSLKINKYLTDEYIKYVSLKDKNMLSHNKTEVIQTANIAETDLSDDIKSEFRKAHSNLILILFNKGDLKHCNEYIDQFFTVQDNNDEKVNFYKYIVLYSLHKYKESKHFLEKLCESKNKENYLPLLSEINTLIDGQIKQKNTFIKKMFKFN